MAALATMRAWLLSVVVLTLLAGPAGPAEAYDWDARWQLEERAGSTMYDSTGNGHTGQIYDARLGQPGVAGYSYGFNGYSSRVVVPDRADLDPGNRDFRVSAWMQFTALPKKPADYDVVRKGIYSSRGGLWKMQIARDGRANCRFEGSTGAITIRGGPALNDGRWHNVQCLKRATFVQIWVDFTAYTKYGKVGTIDTTAPLTIGAKQLRNDFFRGYLDQVAVEQT